MLDVLGQLGAILIISFFLKELGDRINFPFIVLLIFGGTLLATYNIVDIKSLAPFPELIRTLALVLVVYSSAFHLNIDDVKKHSKSIVMLATLGVFLTALLTSATMFYLLPIPLLAALFLGALLSGTDPAAISSAIPKKSNELASVLRAESLFNSPFTVILPLLLLDFVKIPETAILNVPKIFLLIIIGILVGVAIGLAGKWLLERIKSEHTETLGLAIAIATYIIAEPLLGSGILAVAICSIILNSGNYESKNFMGAFNSELAFISTLFVFVLLGSQFKVDELIFSRAEIFAVIIALIVARLLTSAIVLFHSEFNIIEKIKIGMVGPKGVGPAALAPLVLGFSDKIIGADLIVKITYIAIVVSTLVSLLAVKISLKPEETDEEKMQNELEKKKKIRELKKIIPAKKQSQPFLK